MIIVIGWNPIKEQWIKDHPVKEPAQESQPNQMSDNVKAPRTEKHDLPGSSRKKIDKVKPKPEMTKQQESLADVALSFVTPSEPTLLILNLSDSVVRDIKWAVTVWNMDLPDRNDPLPIPVQTFDWLKGHKKGGPQSMFSSPLVSPLLKPGNWLFGSAAVSCPECPRGKTYVVYIVWGKGGWFSEVENMKSGELLSRRIF